LEAKNPKHELKPGTSVKLALTAKTVNDALVVPASAVIAEADGTSAVMIAGVDGRAHQKAVKTGIRQGDDVQIVEGLNATDRVVASGAYGLPDNSKIKVEAAMEAPSEQTKPGSEGSSEK
jgi:Cu(I)/Ag(I) efflux system membrane fusion protein